MQLAECRMSLKEDVVMAYILSMCGQHAAIILYCAFQNIYERVTCLASV